MRTAGLICEQQIFPSWIQQLAGDVLCLGSAYLSCELEANTRSSHWCLQKIGPVSTGRNLLPWMTGSTGRWPAPLTAPYSRIETVDLIVSVSHTSLQNSRLQQTYILYSSQCRTPVLVMLVTAIKDSVVLYEATHCYGADFLSTLGQPVQCAALHA